MARNSLANSKEVYTFHAGEVERIAKQEITELINKLKPIGFNYRHMFIYKAETVLSYVDTWTALTPIEKLIGYDTSLKFNTYPLEVTGAYQSVDSWESKILFSTYSHDEVRTKLKEIVINPNNDYEYYAVSMRAKVTPIHSGSRKVKQKTFIYTDLFDDEMCSFYLLDPNNKFRV